MITAISFSQTFINNSVLLLRNFIDVIHCIGEWAGVVVNIIILATAVYTFIFHAYNPVIYPLKKLLGSLGLSFWEASVIAWKCRDKPSLYARFYMETAIVHSRGIHSGADKWHDIRDIFSKTLSEYKNGGQFVINAVSVSDILTEEIKSLINAYFDLCDVTSGSCRYYFWRKYLLRHTEISPEGFSALLSVSNGYVAPLARITGLNDRFEQNWQRIINNYDSTVSDMSVRAPQGLSLTYTWLMWGPSMEIDVPAENDGRRSLGIYGCGDEANSIHIVMDARIRNTILSYGGLCAPCSVVGRLHNPKYYVKTKSTKFDPLSDAFLERIYYSCETSFDYILEVEEVHRARVSVSAGYFTAYIWAMFMYDNITATASDGRLRLSDTIVFFEHANLADGGNYDYLRSCLLSKIAAYFKRVPDDRRYYYCCAMNRDIDDLIRQKSADGSLSEKIVVGAFDKRSVLETIDAHFDMTKYVRMRSDKFAQIVKLHYEIYSDEGLPELCKLLKCDGLVVVGALNDAGELVAVYSEHPEDTTRKIELFSADERVVGRCLKEFYSSCVKNAAICGDKEDFRA